MASPVESIFTTRKIIASSCTTPLHTKFVSLLGNRSTWMHPMRSCWPSPSRLRPPWGHHAGPSSPWGRQYLTLLSPLPLGEGVKATSHVADICRRRPHVRHFRYY